ncbi:hypothetical protein BWI97_10390 [Siphonobacter sp. BAB-5405]|uniref:ABC transporter permease n=1 Tax=Siphonobacter sp. BAB-5405 TaxID=1864825 RepID=UPI000C7FA7C1|nr:ABC transporter permease [Siphonobacter sp. BAB-5405]PMD96582.1 hypothetical protein BWI97_10390 [Siphonobacter sp. BAB-5405]
MFGNFLTLIFRQFARQKVYTFLHLAGLAVGIAGGILTFLFIRYHYTTDRHHQKFDRIFRVVTDLRLDDGSVEAYPEAMPPLAPLLRRQFPQVEEATFFVTNQDVTVRQGDRVFPEHTGVFLVDSSYFKIFDYQWKQGTPASLQKNTAILTERWAKKYFGDRNPMGQRLDIDKETSVLVTGIIADPPPTTDLKAGMFLPLDVIPTFEKDNWWYLNSTNRVYATLKDPTKEAQMEQAMPKVIRKALGADARYIQLHWQPLRDVHFDPRTPGSIRRMLVHTLAWVGLFLVLTACMNFINLTTAQSLRRVKEVGIRKSLGSSRRQLLTQFLLETAVLVGIAFLLALFLVEVLLPYLNQWTQSQLSWQLDTSLTFFLLLLAGTITGLAGAYPAYLQASFAPIAALKGTLRSHRTLSLRQVLTVTQFVVCQVLITGAIVMVCQTRYFEQADLGFKKDNILLINLPEKGKEHVVRQALETYPEIQALTFQFRPPSSTKINGGTFKFADKASFETFALREKIADAAFIPTYGLQLVAGRNIIPSDTLREIVVNEAFLRKLHLKDPNQILGRKLDYYLAHSSLPIVGVVKDFHHLSLHKAIEPCFIGSQASLYQQVGIKLAVDDLEETLPRIRTVWEKIYPQQPFEYQWLDQQLAQSYQAEGSLANLIVLFAGVAVWICGLGLFGLIRFMAETRTKEIGIRKVLGASEGQILYLFGKSFVIMAALGFVVAVPIATVLMQSWLEQFTYRISLHWLYFGGTLLSTLALTLAVIAYQSIRAARTNPVYSLKAE